MVFTKEDQAFIKNLYRIMAYGPWKYEFLGKREKVLTVQLFGEAV